MTACVVLYELLETHAHASQVNDSNGNELTADTDTGELVSSHSHQLQPTGSTGLQFCAHAQVLTDNRNQTKQKSQAVISVSNHQIGRASCRERV